jgi:hypothetical protein
VINNVDIDDEEVFLFFKGFASAVSRFEKTTLYYDDGEKSLLSYLWQIFAGWSWRNGYHNEEITKVMIRKI